MKLPIRIMSKLKNLGQMPYVEFIGKYDGRFIGSGLQSQTVDWIPEKSGLFFIETFVWDKNDIPYSRTRSIFTDTSKIVGLFLNNLI